MSLKAFHLVFIIASILLAAGFSAWLLVNYFSHTGGVSYLVAGVASALASAGLIGYEIFFLKKLKHISYL